MEEKTQLAAFKYLTEQQKKQSKILHIKYKSLDLQEYLLAGNKNINVSRFIFKARSQTLDIKMQKKWKYEDKNCIGCKCREESGEGKEQMVKPVQYDMFYGELSDMLLVANCMMKKMKARQTIIDNG